MTDDDGYPLGINWETFVGDISVATPVFNWRARHRGGQRRRAHLWWKVSEVQWKLMPTTAHGAKSPPAALGYAGHHRFSLRTTSKRSNVAMRSAQARHTRQEAEQEEKGFVMPRKKAKLTRASSAAAAMQHFHVMRVESACFFRTTEPVTVPRALGAPPKSGTKHHAERCYQDSRPSCGNAHGCVLDGTAKDERDDADALKQNFLAQHEIGHRFQISPGELPPPKSGSIVTNRPLTLPHAGQVPQVPPGFKATAFATRLVNPRRLLVLPNGDVLVAEQNVGYLTLLRGTDADGHAAWIERHVEDLNKPYGLAWRDGYVLVADQDGIWQVPHQIGALRAGRRPQQQKVDQVAPEDRRPIPSAYGAEMISKKGVFGIVQGHQNRHLAIDPKTGALFVGVGSSGNLGVEPEPKATIQRFDADGSNQTTYASGTRNPTTLAFHPQTGELWAGVQERDGLGDRLPSDYLMRVQEGGFYGWPYAYIGKHPQPGFAQRAPDKVEATITPDLLFEAHSSVLDLVFYDGGQFPPEYKGHAFVALKGSWNRSEPTGYKVVRVPFTNGRPEGYYENFVTGFWSSGERRAEVWGRPAALAVTKEGALLIADDTGGTIWRVSYVGGE